MYQEKVATELVKFYYDKLNSSPKALVDLYTPNAQLIHAVEGQKAYPVKGSAAISNHIERDYLGLIGSVVALTSLKVLLVPTTATLVVVVGEIKRPKSSIKTFTQTFILSKSANDSVKISSDIFTLLKTEADVFVSPASTASAKAATNVATLTTASAPDATASATSSFSAGLAPTGPAATHAPLGPANGTAPTGPASLKSNNEPKKANNADRKAISNERLPGSSTAKKNYKPESASGTVSVASSSSDSKEASVNPPVSSTKQEKVEQKKPKKHFTFENVVKASTFKPKTGGANLAAPNHFRPSHAIYPSAGSVNAMGSMGIPAPIPGMQYMQNFHMYPQHMMHAPPAPMGGQFPPTSPDVGKEQQDNVAQSKYHQH